MQVVQGFDMPPDLLARIAAMVGDAEFTIALLEKAFEEENSMILFFPRWQEIKPFLSDPRLQDLMRRLNLEP